MKWSMVSVFIWPPNLPSALHLLQSFSNRNKNQRVEIWLYCIIINNDKESLFESSIKENKDYGCKPQFSFSCDDYRFPIPDEKTAFIIIRFDLPMAAFIFDTTIIWLNSKRGSTKYWRNGFTKKGQRHEEFILATKVNQTVLVRPEPIILRGLSRLKSDDHLEGSLEAAEMIISIIDNHIDQADCWDRCGKLRDSDSLHGKVTMFGSVICGWRFEFTLAEAERGLIHGSSRTTILSLFRDS